MYYFLSFQKSEVISEKLSVNLMLLLYFLPSLTLIAALLPTGYDFIPI